MPLILHLADIHIGAPFDFLPPESSMLCRTLQFEALTRAVDQANDLGASAILIAGDLFDTPDIVLPLYSQTMDVLSRAHCPVLISPGNHDYLHPRSPYETAAAPPNVHIFKTTELSPFVLPGENAVIWGAAFCGMSARIPLSAPLDREKCNLLCIHGELLSNNAYNFIRPEELAQSRFDYAAFGHNHDSSGVLQIGVTTFACPGCFSGTGPNENGVRGYLIGHVEKGCASMRFQPSVSVLFETLSLDMSNIADDRALGHAVASLIPAEHERTCLTLELIGERLYEPDLPGLRHALSQICIHAALRDRTARILDLWRYAETDDLRGAVTRRFRAKSEAALADTDALYALKIALAALDGAEFPT